MGPCWFTGLRRFLNANIAAGITRISEADTISAIKVPFSVPSIYTNIIRLFFSHFDARACWTNRTTTRHGLVPLKITNSRRHRRVARDTALRHLQRDTPPASTPQFLSRFPGSFLSFAGRHRGVIAVPRHTIVNFSHRARKGRRAKGGNWTRRLVTQEVRGRGREQEKGAAG